MRDRNLALLLTLGTEIQNHKGLRFVANSENYKMYTLSQEVSFFGNTNELLTKEEWLIHMINSCYKKDIARKRGI